MGLFDFLKKKEETEKVRVEDLESWLRGKKNKIGTEEKNFLKVVNDKVLQLIQKLEEERNVLERIDLTEKREKERTKILVMDNLNVYILHVNNLIKDLTNFKENELYKLQGEINLILFSFEEKSLRSYERATILIGEEIADIKNTVRDFFKDLKKLSTRNKDLIERCKGMKLVENELIEINKINNLEFENQKTLKEMKENRKNLQNEKISIEKSIDQIKKTERYDYMLKSREEIKDKLEEIDKEKSKLKILIDYKLLARHFHSNKKKMGIIKKYKESFGDIFEENSGEEIIYLLNEAGMDSNPLSKKIKEILRKQEEVDNISFEKDETEDLSYKIGKIDSEIKKSNEKVLDSVKQNDKLEMNRGKRMESMSNWLNKMKVDIILKGGKTQYGEETKAKTL